MANSDDNMILWDQMKTVDRKFTKPITGKSYKGDSPNPTYVIRKLTEALGPIGNDWGFRVMFDRVRLGVPHQVIVEQTQDMSAPRENGKQATLGKTVKYEIIREEKHEVCIRFWFKNGTLSNGEPDIGEFDAYGGTPMLYKTNAGKWMHDEDAAKKSLTDAYTKGASWLGACADIFLGLFDDKYSGAEQSSGNPNVPSKSDKKPPSDDVGKRKSTTPSKDGWD